MVKRKIIDELTLVGSLRKLSEKIAVSSCFCVPGILPPPNICSGCGPVVKEWARELGSKTDDEEFFTGQTGLFKHPRLMMLIMKHCPSFIPEHLLREHLPSLIHRYRELNFCITGQAGCGKSYIIGKTAELFRENGVFFALSAPTGPAALNIEGTTLHSQFGFIPKDEERYKERPDSFVSSFIRRLKKPNSKMAKLYKELVLRWTKLEVLICDEVSMVNEDMICMIDHVAREIRKRPKKPFGGIQVVFAGDFLQLPPVVDRGKQYKFLFEHPIWRQVNCICLLTENKRQGDGDFQQMLTELRLGVVTIKTEQLLRSQVVQSIPDYTQGVDWTNPDDVLKIPVLLVGTNEQVAHYNKLATENNPNETITFTPRVRWYKYNEEYENLLRPKQGTTEAKFDETKLVVCEAPKDMDEAKAFMTTATAEIMKEQHFKIGSLCESTVNKFDKGVCNGTMFVVTGTKPSKAAGIPWHPIGQMDNGDEIEVSPARYSQWIGGDIKKFIVVDYLPFREVYAMTIHRAQGKTLSKVFVDMSRIFSPGHGYIALSRCKTLQGMTLFNFNPRSIQADKRALAFYKDLK